MNKILEWVAVIPLMVILILVMILTGAWLFALIYNATAPDVLGGLIKQNLVPEHISYWVSLKLLVLGTAVRFLLWPASFVQKGK